MLGDPSPPALGPSAYRSEAMNVLWEVRARRMGPRFGVGRREACATRTPIDPRVRRLDRSYKEPMKLLCGIDFSDGSMCAARVAARLAGALGAQLALLHAPQLPMLALRPEAGARDGELARRRTMLAGLASELEPLAKQQVLSEVIEGLPEDALAAAATRLGVALIVIGATGDRPRAEWNLGSTAARTIKGLGLPVLVVREEASVERWLGGGMLRLLVGADGRDGQLPPLELLEVLRSAGRVEASAGHVYSPGEERRRQASEEHERALAAKIGEKAAKSGIRRVRVAAGFGRVAEHLLELATAEQAELIVLGTHRRQGWDRLVHGSVSLDIVALSRVNALVVPLVPNVPAIVVGALRRVLVPVDFSPLSSRALHWGARLLPAGGRLQLVHVTAPYASAVVELGAYAPLPPPGPDELARDRGDVERRLRELIPSEIAGRGLEFDVEAATGYDAATAIVDCATRLGSDLICLPTHGRSGLSRALMGSVTQGVLRRSPIPVLVVPPPERRVHS
jgi:nucleotide-binding universal stress UspA family protein